MRVLALVEALGGASARLRVERFLPWLASQGVAVEQQALVPSGPRRWRQLARAADHDVVWLQRRLPQPWESAWLRARARRLVVDLDDAVWRRDASPFRSRGRAWRARALCSRADVVVAGAASLAGELRELGVAAAVVPTPVPPDDAAAGDWGARALAPTLLWIGQPSTWRYVARFAAAWGRVRAALPDARWIVVGAPDCVTSGDGIDARPWSLAGEEAALREAWLGLAPLADDPWTRGKCGARLLGYLAAGLPAVASRVGAQSELAAEFRGVVDWPPCADGVEVVVETLRSLAGDAAAAGGAGQRTAAQARRAHVIAARGVDRLGPHLLALLRGGDRAEGRGVAATTPRR